ncbi:protein of unknown function [Cyanobium sp. NIES-981]|nr:protein of unknown function [Cyanobium sp. NIES-981]
MYGEVLIVFSNIQYVESQRNYFESLWLDALLA